MKHAKLPALPRGPLYARADAADANAILAELQKSFASFKDAHAEQIRGVEKKFDDVVSREKLDKVNADVSRLQGAIDELNIKAAAGGLGGGGQDRVTDPEYTKAFGAYMKKGDVQASLNKGTAAEGGYTTPIEWDRTITDKLKIVSPMRELCTVMQISGQGFSKLFNLRGTGSGWVGETAARTETPGPTFGTLNFKVGEIYANPSITQQLLDDSLIDIENWLAGEVETEFAYQENLAFVSGTGANDRPNGILTYVTGGANAATHPFGAIATVNSGAAAAVTADGIENLIYALPSEFRASARFAMNLASIGKVRLLKDGQGNYLWQPSYQAGEPASLAGHPLTEVAAMPDIAAGAKPILFGDFKRAYLIVDSIGVRVLRDPFTNKPYVMFYTTKRVGGGAVNTEAMKAQNIA